MTDKNRWFTDGESFVKCNTDHLIDCFTGIFNGDRIRAALVSQTFRPATLSEYADYELHTI